MNAVILDTPVDLDTRICLTPEGAEALHAEAVTEALADVPLEALWGRREDIATEIKDLYARKTRLDAELSRRINEANPDFDQLSPGSAAIVGESIEVGLTWKREYTWDAATLAEARPHLTQAEYDKLIKVETTGNGTQYNVLIRRGGKLADILRGARKFKSASPTWAAKVRPQ